MIFISAFAQNNMNEPKNKLVVHADAGKNTISRHIYGQFSEHLGRGIYEGFWVGENSPLPNTRGIRNDVIAALKNIKVPNLRWPGGCFADEYHWRDGIGPREQRPTMINTHWGGVTEDNSFGTHEFFDLCEQLDTEPYICGNVGSGTVDEMSKWVEYITFDGKSPMADLRRKNGRDKPWKIKYWGVGNENWGCGGNMTPEYYADLYKRYATYSRNYGDNHLFKVAGGAGGGDFNWTEVMMKKVYRSQMSGLSLHHYVVDGTWQKKKSATQFDESEYFDLPSELKTEDYEHNGRKIPALDVSSSKAQDGSINISIVNVHPEKNIALECEVRGIKAPRVSGKILTASKLNSHNTFDQPDNVKIADFNRASLRNNLLNVVVPAKSVVVLQVK